MTTKEWRDAITVIEKLRYQLCCNIMPRADRVTLTRELAASLRDLAAHIEKPIKE